MIAAVPCRAVTDVWNPDPDRRVSLAVGMVKQQTNESSEFTMSSEDFPALPGSQPERANQSDQGMENSGSLAIGGSAASKQQKQGIQTQPDGQSLGYG